VGHLARQRRLDVDLGGRLRIERAGALDGEERPTRQHLLPVLEDPGRDVVELARAERRDGARRLVPRAAEHLVEHVDGEAVIDEGAEARATVLLELEEAQPPAVALVGGAGATRGPRDLGPRADRIAVELQDDADALAGPRTPRRLDRASADAQIAGA
jgi:hypothetical protein